VWLGFFLYDVLMRFTGLAQARRHGLRRAVSGGGGTIAPEYRAATAGMVNGFPSRYFDDGTPLGSASTRMPDRLDAQSWSCCPVRPMRTRAHGDGAVDKRLVRRDHALVQLLDPHSTSRAWTPAT